MSERLYRFAPDIGWITHLWKSTIRQDHAGWRPTLRRLLPPDGIAIDVGAHGGQFTRLLAGMVPQGLVIAVEPSGYTRSVLRPALWLRGVRNVVVVAAALGAESGAAMLRTPIKRRGDMGYGLANIAAASSPAVGVDVPAAIVAEPTAVTTLDALVTALALSRVDFVKADIEGHEAALIAGARSTLTRFRPALLVEHDASFLARAGSDPEALWAALLGLGYLPHGLTGGRADPVPPGDGPVAGDVLWLPVP